MHKELLKFWKLVGTFIWKEAQLCLRKMLDPLCAPGQVVRALTLGAHDLEGRILSMRVPMTGWRVCVSSSLCHRPWSPAGNSRTVFFFQFCGCKTEQSEINGSSIKSFILMFWKVAGGSWACLVEPGCYFFHWSYKRCFILSPLWICGFA